MVTPARMIGFVAGVGAFTWLCGCAQPSIRSSLESSNHTALSLYLRGLMCERASRLSDALDAYHQALERDRDSPAVNVRVGATYMKLGEPEQALKVFQRALTLEPMQRDALRWIAILQTSQGRIAQAIHAYEQLLTQEPTDRFALGTLADLYILDGQLEHAVALDERLIKEYGGAHQLYFNLGVLYGRLGRLPDAIEALSRALELVPDSDDIRVALGIAYELNQQPDKAAVHYEEAIRLDPLNPRLYFHAARVAMNQGRFNDATRHYETVLDLSPNAFEAIVGLVQARMLAKQFDQAHRLLGNALPASPRRTELYLLLGRLYQEVNAPLEALRAFEQAVASQETAAQAHFSLGTQLERLGRGWEARHELDRTLELDPHHADALNYLGYMDAQEGVNLPEAKALIERALALDPDNGAYVDSLGWVCYKLGDLDTAIRQLERAATLLSTDPTIFDHLGEVYAKHGELEKAEAAWHHALELDDTLEDIKHKLESLMSREATAPTP